MNPQYQDWSFMLVSYNFFGQPHPDYWSYNPTLGRV